MFSLPGGNGASLYLWTRIFPLVYRKY